MFVAMSAIRSMCFETELMRSRFSDVVGIVLDALHDPPLDLLPGLVDGVVLLANLPGERRIAIHDGVEALLHHVLRLHRHRADLRGQIVRLAPGELGDPLGDVLARSPIRSRSLLILSTATTNRRSAATGW